MFSCTVSVEHKKIEFSTTPTCFLNIFIKEKQYLSPLLSCWYSISHSEPKCHSRKVKAFLVMPHGCKCQQKCIADEWLLSGNLRGYSHTKSLMWGKLLIPSCGTHIRIIAGQDLIALYHVHGASCPTGGYILCIQKNPVMTRPEQCTCPACHFVMLWCLCMSCLSIALA